MSAERIAEFEAILSRAGSLADVGDVDGARREIDAYVQMCKDDGTPDDIAGELGDLLMEKLCNQLEGSWSDAGLERRATDLLGRLVDHHRARGDDTAIIAASVAAGQHSGSKVRRQRAAKRAKT